MGTITVQASSGPVTVQAYSVAGVAGFTVTRAVTSRGYVVTHAVSGLRMPGEPFARLSDARSAVRQLVDVMPDAPVVADAIAEGRASARDKSVMASAWRGILADAGDATELARRAHRAVRLGNVVADILPDGWTGDVDTLTCPCGHVIEHDGVCPSGCVSPLRALGVI